MCHNYLLVTIIQLNLHKTDIIWEQRFGRLLRRGVLPWEVLIASYACMLLELNLLTASLAHTI